jgi:microcompartment protein CcmK/EutM
MIPISDGELAGMQGTQVDAMPDTCQILRQEEVGVDPYGYPLKEYVVIYTGACGLDASDSEEVMEDTQVAVVDAKVRLPLSVQDDFDNLDRIRITHRFDVELDEPQVFSVIGDPERGPSGLVLELRLITDGSGV